MSLADANAADRVDRSRPPSAFSRRVAGNAIRFQDGLHVPNKIDSGDARLSDQQYRKDECRRVEVHLSAAGGSGLGGDVLQHFTMNFRQPEIMLWMRCVWHVGPKPNNHKIAEFRTRRDGVSETSGSKATGHLWQHVRAIAPYLPATSQTNSTLLFIALVPAKSAFSLQVQSQVT